jgi:hypothetical protein
MAFHCYHRTPCPACGRFFVRFDEAERCPACGGDAAPVYDVVSEIVGYARLTLTTQGDLGLGEFAPSTEADLYVVLAYEVLDAYRLHADLDPALVADEAAAHYQLGWDDARRAHWRRFFTALLARWRADRHKPLPIVLAPSEIEVPTDAVSGGVPRPASEQTFLKKWRREA